MSIIETDLDPFGLTVSHKSYPFSDVYVINARTCQLLPPDFASRISSPIPGLTNARSAVFSNHTHFVVIREGEEHEHTVSLRPTLLVIQRPSDQIDDGWVISAKPQVACTISYKNRGDSDMSIDPPDREDAGTMLTAVVRSMYENAKEAEPEVDTTYASTQIPVATNQDMLDQLLVLRGFTEKIVQGYEYSHEWAPDEVTTVRIDSADPQDEDEFFGERRGQYPLTLSYDPSRYTFMDPTIAVGFIDSGERLRYTVSLRFFIGPEEDGRRLGCVISGAEKEGYVAIHNALMGSNAEQTLAKEANTLIRGVLATAQHTAASAATGPRSWLEETPFGAPFNQLPEVSKTMTVRLAEQLQRALLGTTEERLAGLDIDLVTLSSPGLNDLAPWQATGVLLEGVKDFIRHNIPQPTRNQLE